MSEVFGNSYKTGIQKPNVIIGIALSLLCSFVLLFFPGFIRAYSLKYDFVASHAAYFLAVYIMAKKFEKSRGLIALSFAIIPVSAFLMLFGSRWMTSPAFPNFVSDVLGCIGGYLFASVNSRIKWLPIAMCSGICLFYFFIGNNYWGNYYSFGTINGKVNQKVAWTSRIDNNTDLEMQMNKGKIILLDVFNTGCGVCFQKFPKFQEVYDKYRNNQHVAIYALNIPLKRDTAGMAVQMIREDDYSFPVLIGKEKCDSFLGVQYYPTVILARNDSILFRGELTQATELLEELVGVD